MQIQENFPLKSYNTFGIDAKARYFSSFKSLDELAELRAWKPKHKTFILGGGSNTLFTRDYDGLVLKNDIMGIEELHEDPEHIFVKVGAGENWHRFVLYCIDRNWAGVENLSLIPGNTGAAPIQNIGAYGMELSELFLGLEAYHLQEKKVYTFTMGDCQFGYRDSIFKKKHKDLFVILNITLRLRKQPIFHTTYGALEEELERMGVNKLSIKAISQAVINIRTSKLPDPAEIGNAGSFFKNPEVAESKYENLKSKFPGIVGFPLVNGNVKLAAGWLIEQCGPKNGISWKGYRRGDAGCHEKQALVLVNYGNAKGKEIYKLSEEILLSVKKKFGIVLEREVNVI